MSKQKDRRAGGLTWVTADVGCQIMLRSECGKKHAVKKHAVMHGMGVPNAEHGYLTIFSCMRTLIVLTVNRGRICRHKSMK